MVEVAAQVTEDVAEVAHPHHVAAQVPVEVETEVQMMRDSLHL